MRNRRVMAITEGMNSMRNGSRSKAVVGVFSYIDDVVKAVHEARERDWEYRVYSPCAMDELEDIAGKGKSAVRVFTLAGGLGGLVFGFGLTVLCSMDFPLRVSAKPIVSLPAFAPIGYECTILFAAMMTFFGVALLCRLPYLFRNMGYDPRFSDDKFGVVVACDGLDVPDVGDAMKKAGAEEVTVRDAL